MGENIVKGVMIDEDEEAPLRAIFCLKNTINVNMREIEEREDCFILDFDPNDFPHLFKLSMSKDHLDIPDLFKFSMSKDLDIPDLSVLAEKGQVACRDYPHSRHLCFKNPFEKTHHESYCELCYCFVCDIAAPCKYWWGFTGHCHVIDNETGWSARSTTRQQNQNR